MSQALVPIQRDSLFRRCMMPAGIVFFVMVVSLAVYRLSWQMDRSVLHGIVSNASAVVLFISIGFGSLLVYPVGYIRGAGVAERILASLFTPAAWTVKEIVRVGEFFSFWECLYYALNSLMLLTFFVTVGLMGICEIICRRVVKKRKAASKKGITPVPIAAIILSLIALYVLLIWGVGVHWFYIYMEGYKALFTY